MVLRHNYSVSFDATLVGTEATKYLCLDHETQGFNFIIEPHPHFEAPLSPFVVRKKSTKNAGFGILVRYSPTVPCEKSVNYYLIKNERKSIVLRVTGECIALKVTASVSKLTFFRLQNENKTRATFELSNLSATPIQFQFDIDNKQSLFHVEPVFGKICGGKHVYIQVRFATDKPGVFYLPLACLVLYHAPIFIELMAVNALHAAKNILTVFLRRPSHLAFEFKFERYHLANAPESVLIPPCSLSQKYLNFTGANTSSVSLVSVKNTSDKRMKIKLDTENEQVFRLEFPTGCLQPGDSATMECEFAPKVEDYLYGSILYGRAVPIDDNATDGTAIECSIPYPFTLRTTGNAFSGHSTWLPQVEISPENVKMPVTIAGEKVYATFQIKRLGRYPIVYQFVSPARSHFSIVPRSGFIEDEYQIFVVRFVSDDADSKSYQETWRVQFNYLAHGGKNVCLNARVERPRLRVGRNDFVTFKNIFPGCEERATVPVQNLTDLSLRYRFFDNAWIRIEHGSGEIHCHETVHLNWTYTAQLDVPDTFPIAYELSVLQNGCLEVGTPYEGCVTVHAEASYAKLCATPSHQSLTELVCGEQIRFAFHVFNFGRCQANFTLKMLQNFELPGHAAIELEPKHGSLNAQQRLLVEGRVLPDKPGPGLFCVKYYIVRSAASSNIVDMDGDVWPGSGVLYECEYYSGFPVLKIVDIGKNKAGPLFGKLSIWEIFDIERLNTVLRGLQANQTVDLDVYLPEAQADVGISKLFTFVVKNTGHVDTVCRLARQKNCACRLREVRTHGSVRRYTYADCPHRRLLDVSMSDETVRAQDIQYLVIEVFYRLFGAQSLLYTMSLSHGRTVNLFFRVRGLQPATLSIYAREFTFAMYNVYIGEMEADLQIFWLYNNTRSPAMFALDTDLLDIINRQYRTNVLTCLNPKDKVNAKGLYALIFQFCPLQAEPFQVDLPLFLGDAVHNFSVTGRGSTSYRSPIIKVAGSGPGKEVYFHPGLQIHISIEHFIIPALATFSSATRIFALKNITKDKQIAFCFERFYSKQIVYATVEPNTGILRPNEQIWLRMHVRTYAHACAVRFRLCCHLLDKSSLLEHIQSCEEYHQEASVLHQGFEITDKGTTYPTSTVSTEPQPQIFHRVVGVSCQIVAPADLDLKMPLHQQLKQLPAETVPLYTEQTLARMLPPVRREATRVDQPIGTVYAKRVTGMLHERASGERDAACQQACGRQPCPRFEDSVYSVIHVVLECLIHDVLASRKFKYFIQLLQNQPNKYYAEFRHDELGLDAERTMATAVLNQAPNSLVSEVLQQLVYDCVRQHFRLFTPPAFEKDEASGKLRFNSIKSKSVYIEKFSFLFDD